MPKGATIRKGCKPLYTGTEALLAHQQGKDNFLPLYRTRRKAVHWYGDKTVKVFLLVPAQPKRKQTKPI